MSIISQISSNVLTATYEPKLRNDNESKDKKGDKLKDSVAFSDKVSVLSSEDNNIAALKRIAESQPDIRAERVSSIKSQIANGTYSFDDKIDAISDNIIHSMFA